MTFAPNQFYRVAFREGFTGWDVWAIQISLNAFGVSPTLVEDGAFGPRTKAAVVWVQSQLKITADGICGLETQRKLCAREADRVSAGKVPKGIVRGICEGESGGIIPTTTPLYTDHSRDYGPYQNHLADPAPQQALKESFSAYLESRNLVTELRGAFNEYMGQPGAKTGEEAWRLAVLHHNWPAASFQIAAGNGNSWTFKETKTSPALKLSDPAPWIIAIGVTGVSTGWQWCEHYINSKTVYVTSWTV